jgi:hypothetical protein
MSDLSPNGVTISAVQWMAARDVLGGEASRFTPWLADNLDILADALGLAELTLVETESDVGGNRLDILASGVDDDADIRPVAIENHTESAITDTLDSSSPTWLNRAEAWVYGS